MNVVMERKYNKRGRRLNTNPLRLVVGWEYVDVGINHPMPLIHEKLECGHYQLPKHDIYGETNAARRRCRQCGRETK